MPRQIVFGTADKFGGDAFIKAFNFGELLNRRKGQLLHVGEAFGHQQPGDDVVHVQGIVKQAGAAAELFLTAFAFLGFGQNIDIPVRELACQAHVLAAPADGEAQLIIRHHHFGAFGVLIDHHFGYLGRSKRVDDKGCRLGRPGNDVDFLALELLHHSLHARAFHAHAGAHRIDRRIAAIDGHFGTRAGIPRDSLDFDDAVVNLRHFLRKELGEKPGMRAGEKNLRPARLFANVINIGPHPIAVAKSLALDKLFFAQERFGATEINHKVAVFRALDGAVYDFADTVFELQILAFAFVFAHLLHNDLLCRLRGDAAEIDGGKRVDQIFADLDVGLDFAGNGQRDLRLFVLDMLDHFGPTRKAHFTGLAVDARADVLFMAVFGAAGFLNCLLHRLENFFTVDGLLSGDGIRHHKEFGSGDGCIHGFHKLFRLLSLFVSQFVYQLLCLVSAVAAINASVSTSLARRMEANGKLTSVSSSRRNRATVSFAPSTIPAKRLRPPIGAINSTCARWPANRFQSFTRTSGRSIPGELTSSVQAPGIGSATSITGPRA